MEIPMEPIESGIDTRAKNRTPVKHTLIEGLSA